MTAIASRERLLHGVALRLIQGDITALDIDAFVFYAEPDLALGSGFGTAITVRGGPSIQRELSALGPLATGEAVLSKAGDLKAGHIIHAVGPRFQEEDTEGKLRATVRACLARAEEAGLRRIALPAMGAGFYGIPLDLCARTMLEAIDSHLGAGTGLREVILCVLDHREFLPFEAALEALDARKEEA